MRFFVKDNERKNTNYHEFYKGRWDGVTFWKEDSLLLHMDIFDQLNLYSVFIAALPDFNYYGETYVTPAQYELLKSSAFTQGGEIAVLFAELDIWVSECFKTESCFIIQGI